MEGSNSKRASRSESPCRLWWRDSKERRTANLEGIRKSSKKGCELCTFFLQVIENVKPEWTESTINEDINRIVSLEWVAANGSIHEGFGGALQFLEGIQMVASCQLFLPVVDDQLYALRRPTPRGYWWDQSNNREFYLRDIFEMSGRSDSPAAFSRMNFWLSYCLTNDEGCRVSKDRRHFMPRRLLDLRLKDEGRVSLVEQLEPMPYVCLSYCWGGDVADITKTTLSNLSDHIEGIRTLSLPKGIQDAITICRGLEIRYLWVDALCIIQDDVRDWQKESAQMIDIYAACTLTIAALEPNSCKKRFLGEQRYGAGTWQRSLDAIVPAILGGPANRIIIRFGKPETPERDGIGAAATAKERVEYSLRQRKNYRRALETRGWCLQEAILPNRVLYFDGTEIVWRCLQRTLCECGHRANRKESTHSSLKVALGHGSGSSSVGLFDLYGSWHDIVRDYSLRWLTRKTDKLAAISGLAELFSRVSHGPNIVEDYSNHRLTRRTDKLAAISGLARIFSRISHDPITQRPSPNHRVPFYLNDVDSSPGEYCAGLWRSRFIQELTWNVDLRALESTGRDKHTRPTQYCAPTWTWASIDGPVNYLYRSNVGMWKYKSQLIQNTELLEVSCTYLDANNSFGPVTSGYAILKGPLIPVRLAVLDEDLKLSWYNQRSSDSLLPLSARPCLVRGKDTGRFEVVLDLPMEPTIVAHSPNAATWTSGDRCKLKISDTPYYCLKLFSWQDARGMPKKESLSKSPMTMAPEVWFLLLKRHSENIESFERLGIGCWDAGENEGGVGIRGYQCGLFKNASIKTVKII